MEPSGRKSIIVVFSGGFDSTVLLNGCIRQGHDVRALSVDYGQRHKRELHIATTRCFKLGIEHRIADLSGLTSLLGGSSQTDPSIPVPHGHYAEESMKKTVVPNRNMLLLAVAGAWAVSVKADGIAYAAHAGDHAIYPDCREEFVKPMEEAFAHCDWHAVKLWRPYLKWTKADIVAEGARQGIGEAMFQSYSCYEGTPIQCGVCGTCVERRMAFIAAGMDDFTEYRLPLPAQYATEAQAENIRRAKANVA